jgi:CheY-like chemotaxis protein
MHSPNILLVDDDPVVLQQLTAELQAEGYNVTATASHTHALGIICGTKPIDILITDLVMPAGVNGFALARMARMQWPEIKVIYITGYSLAPYEKMIPDPSGPILSKPLGETLVDGVAAAADSAEVRL